MMPTLKRILEQIAPHNNIYRDRNSSILDKLSAMWEIGDILAKAGVTNPHSAGWKIQEKTGGVVKRPTIFRSHKFRVVWPDKAKFLRTFGAIQGLSSLVEMLPLLDPAQADKHHVPNKVVKDLVRQMSILSPSEFKSRLDAVKKKYADGTLGKRYDRLKHLDSLRGLAQSFQKIYAQMHRAVKREDPVLRAQIRENILTKELDLFSRMCLALTTKENRKLCDELPENGSCSKNGPFRSAYEGAADLLRGGPDAQRARFRKLVVPEVLADLAELSIAVSTEQSVRSYKQRKRLSIAL